MILLIIRRWSSQRHKPAVRVMTALGIALVLNLIFGAAFLLAEREKQPDLSFADSVWWSMVTMTTVGYGDFFPKTFYGRFFVAYPCLLLGIGLIGYSLGVIVEAMMERFNKRQKGTAIMHFENHLVICQCPSTSRVIQLVEQFRQAQADPHRQAVVVTNDLEELPIEFREKSIHFVKGLPTSEEILIRAGVADAAGVIILARDRGDEGCDSESFTSGTLVRLIEEGGSRSISVVIELAHRRNLRMMERAGADGIVPAEGITDMLLTQEMCNPGLRHVFENLATHDKGCEFYIVPQRFTGRPLREIQIAALGHPSNLQVVGILRDGTAMMTPDKSLSMELKDQLILLAAKRSDYEAFESTFLTTHSLPKTA
jgi:voltage-gated potassium channel